MTELYIIIAAIVGFFLGFFFGVINSRTIIDIITKNTIKDTTSIPLQEIGRLNQDLGVAEEEYMPDQQFGIIRRPTLDDLNKKKMGPREKGTHEAMEETLDEMFKEDGAIQ